MSLRALILDYGNVLTELQNASEVEAMGRVAGVAPADFVAGYWQFRPDYDHGLSPAEYWHLVLGRAVEADLAATLTELDFRSWTHYRTELWELLQQYRQRGGLGAMLTNNFPALIARIEQERPFAEWFDTVVTSYQVGVLKPDPRIYQVCLERLGVDAADALFVDDRAVNVEAAVQLGMQGLVFTEEDGMREIRRRLDAA